MAEKYAVFLDIDGTLTYKTPVPSIENIDVIRQVQDKGHYVFINTGRSLRCIPREIFKDIRFDGVIAGVGAYISFKDKVIEKHCLSYDLLERLCRYFKTTGKMCVFEGENNMFYINDVSWAASDWFKVNSINDFENMYPSDPISKITFDGTIPLDLQESLSGELTFIQHPGYVEAAIKGCNKSKGMETALNYLGIGRSNSIAIGDSPNDIDMLEYAGIGIAMGNAPEIVKNIADYITDSNADSGVASALRKYLL